MISLAPEKDDRTSGALSKSLESVHMMMIYRVISHILAKTVASGSCKKSHNLLKM